MLFLLLPFCPFLKIPRISLIRAVAGQRSSPDLCFATKSIKIYDL